MSSNFYTNVQLIGNQFLIRGVEDGKRYETRRDFSPTLFIPTKKQFHCYLNFLWTQIQLDYKNLFQLFSPVFLNFEHKNLH